MAQQQQNAESKTRFDLTVVNPIRLPFPVEAQQYGVDESQWRALVDAVWPNATSVDGILLALSWCKWRKLDPIKRPCHIVPIWNSKQQRNIESVWPSISEVRITAHRTGNYAGIDEAEWGPMKTRVFKGRVRAWKDGNQVYDNREVTLTFPEWCRHTVYRIVAGQRYAWVGPKVHFVAAYGSVQDTELPNEKWQEPGYYMLEKCAEAAALRRAFPEEMGDMVTAEEMEGRRWETQLDMGSGVTVESPSSKPLRPERADPRFSEQPVQDVDGRGQVQAGAAAGPGASQPQTAKPAPAQASAAKPAPKAAAEPAQKAGQEPRKEPDKAKPQAAQKNPPQTSQQPAQQRQQAQAQQRKPEPPREPPEPDLYSQDQGQSADEPEPEDQGAGSTDEDSLVAYDEVGDEHAVGTAAGYVQKMTGLMMAARSEKSLIQLYDNNISTIDKLEEEVKRPIFRVYSEKINELRKAAAPSEQQQPAAQGQVAKYSLFDHGGQPYARNLLTAEFVNGIETLFKKSQDQGRLEAIYRYNSETIAALPEITKSTIVRIYGERMRAFTTG